MVTLENKLLKVDVQEKGAELVSVYHKEHQTEYMWSGDPAFWGKYSPVLFPIVGTLRENAYIRKGNNYTMGRHGFARDRQFEKENVDKNSVCFLLKEDEQSLKIYPFPFEFRLRYTLADNTLQVQYEVRNTGEGDMYFSVGGHPAFAVPLEKGLSYSDYYLEFNEPENAGRWPISPEGLIENKTIPLLDGTNRLPLTKELFFNDALVFKGLKSDRVSLLSGKGKRHLELSFRGFPYLGIWAAKQADFICIEPWCGIADGVEASQLIEEKEGIIKLGKGDSWKRAWILGLY